MIIMWNDVGENEFLNHFRVVQMLHGLMYISDVMNEKTKSMCECEWGWDS